MKLHRLIVVFLTIYTGTVLGQSPGKPGGKSPSNFFNTDSFGGVLGHLETVGFGSFAPSAQWIGIGQPFTGPNSGRKVPAYGLRSQWQGQAGIFALTGAGLVKDLGIQWGSNPESKVRFTFANDLTNPNAVTEVMSLLSNGNVGIGTDSPFNRLHLNANDSTLLRIQSTLGGVENTAGIDFATYAGVGRNARIETIDEGNFNGTLAFLTKSDQLPTSRVTEKMRISGNGDVGIGIDSPLTKLHVNANDSTLLRIQSTLGGVENTAGIDFATYAGVGRNARIETIDEGNFNGTLAFLTKSDQLPTSRVTEKVRIMGNGNVGIGTVTPTAKLDVNGDIRANNIAASRVQVDLGSFPDYVFEENYDLMPLKEVELYINANKHLPEMPSEAEVVENGADLGQLNTLLVQKVEELTLYTIQQDKSIRSMKAQIELLMKALDTNEKDNE